MNPVQTYPRVDALASGEFTRRIHPVVLLASAAIILRLIIFLGRGAYVAFDEGWYLLLGTNLMSGDGYTLSGLRHTVLSPLFPILAGSLSTIVRDPVWAGRIVAAVFAGLLVWPCWHIFHRLGGDSTAWIACIVIAAVPTLAPFAAPYWIGWDLWVGAEPLLHFFLFAGIALALRAYERGSALDWTAAGCTFALAYLARPEAILFFGFAALWLGIAAVRARNRLVLHGVAFILAFVMTAAPYWLYLHDTLDRWAISGRVVQLPTLRSSSPSQGQRAASTIEVMLWENDQRSYMLRLYGLDASATRLSSSYWGVPRERAVTAVTPRSAAPGGAASAAADTADGAPTAALRAAQEQPAARPASPVAPATDRPTRLQLYLRSLGVIMPLFLWPVVLMGLLGYRRTWRMDLLVAMPFVAVSFAIARIVAVDPRTQLFIVPLAAYYAARGILLLGSLIDRRLPSGTLRQGFVARAAVVVLVASFLATEARWVYLGITLGSPHHLVGAANRTTAAALRDIVPPDQPVMSWHPALALYADRDWRVLPHAAFPDVVTYANAIRSEYMVLSAYYPSPLTFEQMTREYLVLHLPPGTAAQGGHLRVELSDAGSSFMLGRVTSSQVSPSTTR